ncbi:FAD-dependent oxidoreductase [Planotetraspora sp. A-T 1434]|uniref:flavin monoamine oxidase family protein n=1 Tax=Planotetraspora sp. A-T 1434 TaxID=2979219 RepID=UPI0021BE971A|nr:FAD-dependent oxidoreductase [Planotetraspora sp. A-T 1434]MCT9934210.1 FAD-dependent oxidoreductase [Planotetraspora sp. A-T 1434]
MARTPLFAALRSVVRQLETETASDTASDTASQTPSVSAPESVSAAGRRSGGQKPGEGMSRRHLLRAAAAAGTMAGLGATTAYGLATPSRAQAATAPRIVVIGAGLAGLTAAYELKKAGYTATVYEASDRLGGRCWSDRSTFAEGQIAEHGGELIDQGHTALLQLTQELGLTTQNLLAAEPNGSEPIYYFDGGRYDYATAKGDLQGIWQQLHSDASAASYPTLYSSYTQRGYELDHMSVRDWINAYVPGGIGSRLGQLLDVAYNIEYGAETSQQSSLNLIYLLAYQGAGNIRIFGKSNEKYHVLGGNDQVATRLAAALTGQIKLGTALRALADRGDGTWAVTVGSPGSSKSTTTIADRVVLALPFSLLRDVDLSSAGFPARKAKAIAESRMGTNSKLQLQFSRRYWYELGGNGESYADTGYQSTWEVTRAQSGTSGILVDYTGGAPGADFGTLTPAQYAARFLGQLEPAMPGITPLWNGRVLLNHWASYPWTRGSYSYWGVGQYTTVVGVEREAVGGCHFAGEHTSVDFQGYLNGAVESGQRAADEVIAALRR